MGKRIAGLFNYLLLARKLPFFFLFANNKIIICVYVRKEGENILFEYNVAIETRKSGRKGEIYCAGLVFFLHKKIFSRLSGTEELCNLFLSRMFLCCTECNVCLEKQN